MIYKISIKMIEDSNKHLYTQVEVLCCSDLLKNVDGCVADPPKNNVFLEDLTWVRQHF